MQTEIVSVFGHNILGPFFVAGIVHKHTSSFTFAIISSINQSPPHFASTSSSISLFTRRPTPPSRKHVATNLNSYQFVLRYVFLSLSLYLYHPTPLEFRSPHLPSELALSLSLSDCLSRNQLISSMATRKAPSTLSYIRCTSAIRASHRRRPPTQRC